MSDKPRFHLTRHAAIALRDIYAHSLKQWGQKTADTYMAALYAIMAKAAAKPDIGYIRGMRAVPFLMVPAKQHFIVYDQLKRGIVIVAILHQRRDIERIIAGMTPAFLAEIQKLRKKIGL